SRLVPVALPLAHASGSSFMRISEFRILSDTHSFSYSRSFPLTVPIPRLQRFREESSRKPDTDSEGLELHRQFPILRLPLVQDGPFHGRPSRGSQVHRQKHLPMRLLDTQQV